jgi:argininosuccinate lyase
VGSVGGKLHTGRSRNDQVATDTRLWLAGAVAELRGCVQELLRVAADRAEAEADVLMPGFTHLQPAQPVRWGHWLMSHASAWQRDDERLRDLLPRVATLPLGSGALAGNPFGVDRRAISRDLGFDGRVCPNSMDAVSDRDFVAEFVFASSLLLTHLSRFSEDLIIYSSGQFGFVACSDAYATGSSLMPQKKNPDALELMRGKAGVLAGNLAGVMAVIKGTPTTYNKDFQEAWPLMFGTYDAAHDCVRIATGVLSTLRIRPERMLAGLSPDMLATDLAGESAAGSSGSLARAQTKKGGRRFSFLVRERESAHTNPQPQPAKKKKPTEYLVRKGVPFRETHHLSGAAVKMAEDRGCGLSDLTPTDLRTIHPLFADDVSAVWDYAASADKRDTEGGASHRSLMEQVAKMRSYLETAAKQ